MAAAVAALRESTLFVERMLKVTFSISNQPSEIPYCSAPTINAKLFAIYGVQNFGFIGIKCSVTKAFSKFVLSFVELNR